jgi:hypothetical protein
VVGRSSPGLWAIAVPGKEYVWLDWQQRRGSAILAAVSEDGWIRLSAGEGAKGPRWYDWRWVPLAAPMDPGWCRWLLIRRRASEPTDLAA